MTGLPSLLGNLRDLLLGAVREVARVGVTGCRIRIHARGATAVTAVASLASLLGDFNDFLLGAIGEVAGVGIASRRHND